MVCKKHCSQSQMISSWPALVVIANCLYLCHRLQNLQQASLLKHFDSTQTFCQILEHYETQMQEHATACTNLSKIWNLSKLISLQISQTDIFWFLCLGKVEVRKRVLLHALHSLYHSKVLLFLSNFCATPCLAYSHHYREAPWPHWLAFLCSQSTLLPN